MSAPLAVTVLILAVPVLICLSILVMVVIRSEPVLGGVR